MYALDIGNADETWANSWRRDGGEKVGREGHWLGGTGPDDDTEALDPAMSVYAAKHPLGHFSYINQ